MTWIRTRLCGCENLECRFIDRDTCPNGNHPGATWLWAQVFDDDDDDETTEDQTSDND